MVSMTPLYTPEQYALAQSRQMLPLKCECCEETFQRSKHAIQISKPNSPRYCSTKCRAAKQIRPRVVVECHQCGIKVEKTQRLMNRHVAEGLEHHYCSSRCAGIVNRPKKPFFEQKQRTCKRCGESFVRTKTHTTSINCPNCLRKRRDPNATLGDLDSWADGTAKHPAWRYGKVRAAARYDNPDLVKSSCALCPYDKHVEIDHIREISSFPPETLLSVINAVRICYHSVAIVIGSVVMT